MQSVFYEEHISAYTFMLCIEIKANIASARLERLKKEIRIRTKVEGIFPSLDFDIRLASCYIIEYAEDWECGRCYIQKIIIQNILEYKRQVA